MFYIAIIIMIVLTLPCNKITFFNRFLIHFSGGAMTSYKKPASASGFAYSVSVYIRPENLIGTKWVATGTISENKDTIEFVNNTYCVYTSINRLEPYTYRIRENRILLGEHISYVIRDNTLFLNGYPLFTRE